MKNGVHETTEYLELFLRNLLLDEKNELHNRAMHISGKFALSSKVNIEAPKSDIGVPKADIEDKLTCLEGDVLSKTKEHVVKLYNKYGLNQVFGRSMVENITGLKSTRASELIKMMLDNDIIEPVHGQGKGKYRFK